MATPTIPLDPQTIIRCEAIWKLYGPDPLGFLRKFNDQPQDQDLQDHGYVSAVNNVSLEIQQGEMLVVMGLSGSGKSTLVRCLSRLIEVTMGQIEIEGKNLLSMSEKELIELRRHKMGMVFQHFALLPHKTVLENVAFPLQMQGMARSKRIPRAVEIIELVGLQGRENNFPRQLSGGQQQRVGIARSLAVEPDIWFLDEPFSALDPLIRREMQDEFLRLQNMLHKTIVFITHDFDEALRLADRIAIMYHGKIEQLDTPENIVLHPATEYVEKFTREIPRGLVLTVGSVMDEGIDSLPEGEAVSVKATIHSIADRVLADREHPIPVEDARGQLIGTLNPKKALKILV